MERKYEESWLEAYLPASGPCVTHVNSVRNQREVGSAVFSYMMNAFFKNEKKY